MIDNFKVWKLETYHTNLRISLVEVGTILLVMDSEHCYSASSFARKRNLDDSPRSKFRVN